MSSTGWEGMGRGQRRNLLAIDGSWKDQGEVLCSFSGVPLGVRWQILSQPSLPFSSLIPPKSEEPSQRDWELEDKKLGRNTVMWETDERKKD